MSVFYTPTTEELLSFILSERYCYGIIRGSETDTVKLIFEDPIENSIKLFIEYHSGKEGYIFNFNTDVFRLPPLSKEDIESLGFFYDVNMSEIEFDSFDLDKGLDERKRYIQYTLKNYYNGRVYLEKVIDSGVHEIGFLGIKNISELKLFLKHSGIL